MSPSDSHQRGILQGSLLNLIQLGRAEWSERDFPDGGATGAESAGNASMVKSKEFEVLEENISDSYAVVALVDKKQYRTEADMMKKEGSGKPEHYSASLKRPIKSSAENTSV